MMLSPMSRLELFSFFCIYIAAGRDKCTTTVSILVGRGVNQNKMGQICLHQEELLQLVPGTHKLCWHEEYQQVELTFMLLYSGKLSRKKTGGKYNFHREKFSRLLACATKRCHTLKFHGENFANSHKTSKFSPVKVSQGTVTDGLAIGSKAHCTSCGSSRSSCSLVRSHYDSLMCCFMALTSFKNDREIFHLKPSCSLVALMYKIKGLLCRTSR